MAGDEETEEQTLDDFIKAQAATYEQMGTFVSNFNKCETRSVGYIDARLEGWEKYWTTVFNCHELIISRAVSADKKKKYFTDDLFAKYENYYYGIKGALMEAKNKLLAAAKSTTPAKSKRSTECKLPVLEAPTFSGNFLDWPSFSDLFQSTITNNTDLTNSQRLQYLRASLKGDASTILRTTKVTDANFAPAWQLLEDRYNVQNALVYAQVRALFSQPKASNANEIKSLFNVTIDCLNALKNMGIDTANWDPILTFLIQERLPSTTLALWNQLRFGKRDVPKWNELKTFLQSCCLSVETESSKSYNVPASNASRTHYRPPAQRSQAFYSSNYGNCKMSECKEKHSIRICPIFLKLDIKERIETARQTNLCLNCLAPGHKTATCSSENRCLTCGKKHHTLLHLPIRPTTSAMAETNSLNSNANSIRSCQILLATAIINAHSRGGIIHQLRVLIDSGSQSSFITERAVQKLNLKKTPSRVQVYGLGRVDAGVSPGLVRLKIGSLHDPLFAMEMEALVMSKLTNLLPSERVDTSAWKHLTGIKLADPNFFDPGHIDGLIGADIYASIVLGGVKMGERGMPLAQETVFGWILTGPTANRNNYLTETVNLHQEIEIDQQLRRLFEDDDMPTERQLTEEEKSCEEQFCRQYQRDETGRYIVPLPFKTNINVPLLGESYGVAINRLRSLERRLQNNPKFAADYAHCLREYVQLDHMESVDAKEPNDSEFTNYLAHQAVIKLSSSSTKLRVVFDASNKTSNGRSLNDILLVGPRLQQDLAFILLRWRKHKYVLSADIEKMYRQVLLLPQHRDFHRLLWRDRPDQPVQIFRMKRVTFGVASAQYMAVKAVQQLAEDQKERFPVAATVAKQDFYVDDLFTGASTIERASTIQNQMVEMMKSGGFPLRQWASNCDALLERIPLADRENQSASIEDDAIIKTLGVSWTPKDDRFVFRVNLEGCNEVPTKRIILSDIAKIYDPPGWLAPVVIVAKMLLKRVWLSGKGWDDELPKELTEFWIEFRSKLKELEKVSIPRWIHYEDDIGVREIHGFCDASEKGYAAVIYTRFIDSNMNVQVNLLISKTRVSPIKPVSLPRLELNGAALLAKLMKRVQISMLIEWTAVHAWCDNQTALQWIHGEPQRWKTYVANRVVQIHENLNCASWHYVRSAENPADCASRGVDPSTLKDVTIWFSGPKWLSSEETKWPIEEFTFDRITGEERRETNVMVATVDNDLLDIIERHSSIVKIFRILAWCRRYAHNTKAKNHSTRISGLLRGSEIEAARKLCVKLVQQKSFVAEINELNVDGHISKKSKLWKLNPKIEKETELLRVDGRLKNAEIPNDEKYPVILPSNHKFTSLYVQHVHESTMHGGVQLVLAFIRKHYWILDARNAIRRQIWKCVKCYRFRAERATQLMGSLPVPRVNFSRSFAHTGVDFAGPIDLRTAIGRGKSTYKGYFSIFICMATRAIHLEAVTGMSTDHFMAAFDRFVSRRGLPSDMYSDNGTNFVGAQRTLGAELHEFLNQLQPTVAERLACKEVNWHFNPPSSPHFGGLWEAGVKSVKFHLKRSFGDKIFTYEEFNTALCQVEACLNSRPLCPQSNDPDDLNFLTPADLLGVRIGLIRPSPSLLHLNENRLGRWQHIQHVAQNFWKKYSGEFLSRMQQRSKWNTSKRNLRVGDMVLVCDELASPNRWPIARITATHPGQDGLIRVVSIKTTNGVYKRPIAKLALLPIEENGEPGS